MEAASGPLPSWEASAKVTTSRLHHDHMSKYFTTACLAYFKHLSPARSELAALKTCPGIQTQRANGSHWMTETAPGDLLKQNICIFQSLHIARTLFGWENSSFITFMSYFLSLWCTWCSLRCLLTAADPVERQVGEQTGSVLTWSVRDWLGKELERDVRRVEIDILRLVFVFILISSVFIL